ncbi:hypothetical protein R3P38DRAFT_3423938 [Favolaschia claudopus]|uniref:Uncharacterized protein n=1 Tax=Favolaschia claudopus TaxID=2862362 RepID=A0AAV9ZYQ4_9AGAR
MFNSKALLATIFAAISVAVASPVKPGTEASANIQVCTGVNPTAGCINVPAVSDACVNLTGGLTFLNKEITLAVIPGGFICTFFEDFGCNGSGTSNGGTDREVVLTGGTWDLGNIGGESGPINFNDLTSSFTCSPL